MKPPFIFDTSVWIDYFKGKGSKQVFLLSEYIQENEQVFLTPTILQEILQGIKEDKDYYHIKDILSYFSILHIPPVKAAVGAADLYRFVRKKGMTIRKSNDCLIAFFALHFSLTVIHQDRDFDHIALHTKLKSNVY